MTSFNDFDQQLRSDVIKIQEVVKGYDNVTAQIDRIHHIAFAAGICLSRTMGPAAAAHILHELADRINAQAKNHVQ